MPKDLERNGTAERLIGAFKENRFVLYRQGIHSLAAAPSVMPYHEIFVRFVEEDEKLLPPGTFIPTLEYFNLMGVLDRWVVRQVLGWLRRAHDKRGRPIARCSINVSIDSLVNLDFARYVSRQIESQGIAANALSFEIAEDDMVAHVNSALEMVSLLKPLGCGVALSGYRGSGIPADALKHLGVDTVKIDGDIIRRLGCDPASQELVRAIIESCRKTDISTVGELVETPESLDQLRSLGADYAQGFAIEKPGPLLDAA